MCTKRSKVRTSAPAGPAGQRASVPLVAAGLTLVIEPITAGPLAPAVMLRVYAGGAATSVGATVPAQHADALAAAIVAAGTRACEHLLFAPPTGEDAPRGA